MARDVANVWWAMFGFSVLVLAVVSALWIHAMLRQPREVDAEQAERINRRWLVGGGLILPMFVHQVLALRKGCSGYTPRAQNFNLNFEDLTCE